MIDEALSFEIRPIARIHTDFSEKFGIPRQSGLVEALRGRIVFEPEYRIREALRGIEDFSHLWLIWRFTKSGSVWHPTVRPPRLGGNRRVGVFATRSPFRPNPLGLSCVKLEEVDYSSPDAPILVVSGADMLDGTPIYDIKPYIPVCDLIPGASEGYTAITKEHRLNVGFECDASALGEDTLSALVGVLENDPRPGYDSDPDNEYGMTFAGFDVGFRVNGSELRVVRLEKLGSAN